MASCCMHLYSIETHTSDIHIHISVGKWFGLNQKCSDVQSRSDKWKHEEHVSQMDMINNRLCEHWSGHSFFIQHAFVFHLEAINIIFESCRKVERHQLTTTSVFWCDSAESTRLCTIKKNRFPFEQIFWTQRKLQKEIEKNEANITVDDSGDRAAVVTTTIDQFVWKSTMLNAYLQLNKFLWWPTVYHHAKVSESDGAMVWLMAFAYLIQFHTINANSKEPTNYSTASQHTNCQFEIFCSLLEQLD